MPSNPNETSSASFSKKLTTKTDKKPLERSKEMEETKSENPVYPLALNYDGALISFELSMLKLVKDLFQIEGEYLQQLNRMIQEVISNQKIIALMEKQYPAATRDPKERLVNFFCAVMFLNSSIAVTCKASLTGDKNLQEMAALTDLQNNTFKALALCAQFQDVPQLDHYLSDKKHPGARAALYHLVRSSLIYRNNDIKAQLNNSAAIVAVTILENNALPEESKFLFFLKRHLIVSAIEEFRCLLIINASLDELPCKGQLNNSYLDAALLFYKSKPELKNFSWEDLKQLAKSPLDWKKIPYPDFKYYTQVYYASLLLPKFIRIKPNDFANLLELIYLFSKAGFFPECMQFDILFLGKANKQDWNDLQKGGNYALYSVDDKYVNYLGVLYKKPQRLSILQGKTFKKLISTLKFEGLKFKEDIKTIQTFTGHDPQNVSSLSQEMIILQLVWSFEALITLMEKYKTANCVSSRKYEHSLFTLKGMTLQLFHEYNESYAPVHLAKLLKYALDILQAIQDQLVFQDIESQQKLFQALVHVFSFVSESEDQALLEKNVDLILRVFLQANLRKEMGLVLPGLFPLLMLDKLPPKTDNHHYQQQIALLAVIEFIMTPFLLERVESAEEGSHAKIELSWYKFLEHPRYSESVLNQLQFREKLIKTLDKTFFAKHFSSLSKQFLKKLVQKMQHLERDYLALNKKERIALYDKTKKMVIDLANALGANKRDLELLNKHFHAIERALAEEKASLKVPQKTQELKPEEERIKRHFQQIKKQRKEKQALRKKQGSQDKTLSTRVEIQESKPEDLDPKASVETPKEEVSARELAADEEGGIEPALRDFVENLESSANSLDPSNVMHTPVCLEQAPLHEEEKTPSIEENLQEDEEELVDSNNLEQSDCNSPEYSLPLPILASEKSQAEEKKQATHSSPLSQFQATSSSGSKILVSPYAPKAQFFKASPTREVTIHVSESQQHLIKKPIQSRQIPNTILTLANKLTQHTEQPLLIRGLAAYDIYKDNTIKTSCYQIIVFNSDLEALSQNLKTQEWQNIRNIEFYQVVGNWIIRCELQGVKTYRIEISENWILGKETLDDAIYNIIKKTIFSTESFCIPFDPRNPNKLEIVGLEDCFIATDSGYISVVNHRCRLARLSLHPQDFNPHALKAIFNHSHGYALFNHDLFYLYFHNKNFYYARLGVFAPQNTSFFPNTLDQGKDARYKELFFLTQLTQGHIIAIPDILFRENLLRIFRFFKILHHAKALIPDYMLEFLLIHIHWQALFQAFSMEERNAQRLSSALENLFDDCNQRAVIHTMGVFPVLKGMTGLDYYIIRPTFDLLARFEGQDAYTKKLLFNLIDLMNYCHLNPNTDWNTLRSWPYFKTLQKLKPGHLIYINYAIYSLLNLGNWVQVEDKDFLTLLHDVNDFHIDLLQKRLEEVQLAHNFMQLQSEVHARQPQEFKYSQNARYTMFEETQAHPGQQASFTATPGA